MEQDMTIYTITRIDEADFGCEGRPEGYIPMVTVYLEDEYGREEVIEMEDAQMYHRALDEGSRVVIGGDGASYQRGDRDPYADGTKVKGAELWAV